MAAVAYRRGGATPAAMRVSPTGFAVPAPNEEALHASEEREDCTSPLLRERRPASRRRTDLNLLMRGNRVSPKKSAVQRAPARSVEEEVNLAEEVVRKLQGGRSYTLHQDGAFMRKWDMFMVALLAFVAFVTPFEVSYLARGGETMTAGRTTPVNFPATQSPIPGTATHRDRLLTSTIRIWSR